MQQLFAEIHKLKRYVDDSLNSVTEKFRKRASNSPGAPTRRPKMFETSDSESNNHG